MPNTTFILAGLKADLLGACDDNGNLIDQQPADSEETSPVSVSEAESVVTQFNGLVYMECSGIQNFGVHDIFETAVNDKFIIRRPPTYRPRKSILEWSGLK